MNKQAAIVDQLSSSSHDLSLNKAIELEHRYGAVNYDPLPVVLSHGFGR